MKKIALIYITNPDKKTAARITRLLLKKRLIGCANIFPIESLYEWKGKIVSEKEFVILAKTFEKNFAKVKKGVAGIHPYSVPCVIKISASANEKYLNWMRSLR